MPKTKVLLLDDNCESLFTVSKILVRQKYETYPVTNLSNATSVLRDNGPDIVIVNWDMQDRKSKQFVGLIKEDLSPLGFIYTIAMACESNSRSMVEAFECGIDGFIRKPINRQELIAKLLSASRIIDLHTALSDKCEQLVKLHGELRMTNEHNLRISQIDELTGLPNRRSGMKRLEEFWALSKRKNVDVACLYLDIDHFKKINDTYGHKVGDIALKHIAQLLTTSTRTGESVFRLGGEEFVILCLATDIDSAFNTGERIRKTISDSCIDLQLNINSPECCSLKMTVSIGIWTRFCENGNAKSPEDLLSKADKQLYLAKENGRNRVC